MSSIINKQVEVSNTDPIPVIGSFSVAPQTVTSENTTSVTVTNVVSTILAANPNRKGYTIWCNENKEVFIRHGAGASTTVFKYALTSKGDYYEMPADLTYKGDITAIVASGTADIKVTELT